MSLRIAFDASSAAKPQRTGVARYATCLLTALAEAAPDATLLLGYRLSRFRRHRHRFRPSGSRVRVRYFLEPFERLSLGRFDLFHGLDARIPKNATRPRVVTLHDVAQIQHPEIASREFRSRKMRAYRRIAGGADRIICVSTATKDAFRNLFELPEERFAVIHHGLEARFAPAHPDQVGEVLAHLGVRPPYLLFLGLLSARKMCVPLVRAFDRVAAALPDLKLVLAGGRAHGFQRIARAIRGAEHRNRIHLPGFVADDLLPSLYTGARAFIFPGHNEGFGIPMLEAMACGTPVVAADVPVSREVAGAGALLLDTSREEALAAGLLELLGDEPRMERMRRSGRARAARFTWRAAAEQTLEVYRQLVDPHTGA